MNDKEIQTAVISVDQMQNLDPNMRALVKEFDTDGDGVIDMDNFISAISSLKTTRESNLLFRRIIYALLIGVVLLVGLVFESSIVAANLSKDTSMGTNGITTDKKTPCHDSPSDQKAYDTLTGADSFEDAQSELDAFRKEGLANDAYLLAFYSSYDNDYSFKEAQSKLDASYKERLAVEAYQEFTGRLPCHDGPANQKAYDTVMGADSFGEAQSELDAFRKERLAIDAYQEFTGRLPCHDGPANQKAYDTLMGADSFEDALSKLDAFRKERLAADAPTNAPVIYTRSATTVSESADHAALCENEFGDSFRVADWEFDLKEFNESEIAGLMSNLGIDAFDPTAVDDWESYYVTREGEKYFAGRRVYNFNYINGEGPGAWFLIHDSIGELYLGSWYDLKCFVLCTNATLGGNGLTEGRITPLEEWSGDDDM